MVTIYEIWKFTEYLASLYTTKWILILEMICKQFSKSIGQHFAIWYNVDTLEGMCEDIKKISPCWLQTSENNTLLII